MAFGQNITFRSSLLNFFFPLMLKQHLFSLPQFQFPTASNCISLSVCLSFVTDKPTELPSTHSHVL